MMDEAGPATIETFDILRLLNCLPHRYPFLMVDRVIDARGDEFGIGIKNVSINEPQFQGHFPERPVMPGVLLIEGMAQTAGVLCVNAHRPGKKPPLVYFMSIDKANFASQSCRAIESNQILRLCCEFALLCPATLPVAANSEIAVILVELMFGMMVAAVVLLLPFLLMMLGVGAAVLLSFVASAALLGALVFWLVFPGIYGLAVLLIVLVIGLLLVDRRSRHRAP
jgi:beta-hydroxyacyl-ACP dehydratase FabZ